jgi:hypothetical protein
MIYQSLKPRLMLLPVELSVLGRFAHTSTCHRPRKQNLNAKSARIFFALSLNQSIFLIGVALLQLLATIMRWGDHAEYSQTGWS